MFPMILVFGLIKIVVTSIVITLTKFMVVLQIGLNILIIHIFSKNILLLFLRSTILLFLVIQLMVSAWMKVFCYLNLNLVMIPHLFARLLTVLLLFVEYLTRQFLKVFSKECMYMSRTFLTYKLGMPWDKHKFEPFTTTDIDRGESITDTSYYVPVAEALKKLKEGHGSVGTITYNGFFDFPAGAKIPTDGSVKPVVGRKPGLDRTQVEAEMAKMAADIESKRSDIEKDVNRQIKKAERSSEIKKILSSSDAPQTTDSK